MAKVQNSTNLYTPNTLIVDASGHSPFTTITSALTAATDMGYTAVNIYIRPGTYTEDLTLVDSFSLTGSNYEGVIVNGTHTIPLAGEFRMKNIYFQQLTPATDIFIESGASSCGCRFNNCYFYPDSGASFNLPTSTGTVNLSRCNGSAVTSDSVFNNAASASFYLINSSMGKGAVATTANGYVLLRDSNLKVPLTLSGAATCNMFGSYLYGSLTASDTVVTKIWFSQFVTGVNTPITANVGTSVFLNNVAIDTSAANFATGAGTVVYNEVTCLDSSAHNATTELYNSRVITGSLQLDEADQGVCLIDGGLVTPTAMTDGQIVMGSTGLSPVVGTVTAGTNISITNAAGSITVNATGPASVTWTTATIDTALVVNNSYVTDIAIPGLLTYTIPATASLGDSIEIIGYSVGGWSIAQNANQSIRLGASTSTIGAGGSVSSLVASDSVKLVCMVDGASTEWAIVYAIGNPTIV